MTHELRTPLTSIRAFTEILLEDPDVELEQRKKLLGIITKETERLTRLINRVLDLAKIESGKAEWVESRVDMKEVIADVLAAMSQLLKENNIKVEVRLPEKVSTVSADLDRVVQVMLNLLSNAVKFCDSASGWVEIALVERDGCLRVEVRDNGRGIRPEDHAAIFDKFRQVGDTLTNKPHGSGLGLHISRHIVEHFGGRMWVESSLGSGPCFFHAADRRRPLHHEAVLDPRADRQNQRSSRGGFGSRAGLSARRGFWFWLDETPHRRQARAG